MKSYKFTGQSSETTVSRLWNVTSGAFLALTAIACLSTAVLVTVGQVTFSRVLTESMAPDIHRGDGLVLKQVSTNDLKAGQVVVLPMPSAGGALYAHRLVSVTHSDGTVLVRTKGDANPVEDPWTLKIESKNTPVVITTLPLSAVPIARFDRPLVFGIFSAAVIIFIALRFRQENRYRRRHVQPT